MAVVRSRAVSLGDFLGAINQEAWSSNGCTLDQKPENNQDLPNTQNQQLIDGVLVSWKEQRCRANGQISKTADDQTRIEISEARTVGARDPTEDAKNSGNTFIKALDALRQWLLA